VTSTKAVHQTFGRRKGPPFGPPGPAAPDGIGPRRRTPRGRLLAVLSPGQFMGRSSTPSDRQRSASPDPAVRTLHASGAGAFHRGIIAGLPDSPTRYVCWIITGPARTRRSPSVTGFRALRAGLAGFTVGGPLRLRPLGEPTTAVAPWKFGGSSSPPPRDDCRKGD